MGAEQAGYTLAIIGCGTMGVAVMSGVLDTKKIQEARRAASAALSQSQRNSERNTNGRNTPQDENGASVDLSASIASLLEIDEGGGDAHDGSHHNAPIQLPGRFLACVARTESAKRLRKTFEDHKDIVEVLASENLKAAKNADVIVLACKPQMVGDILSEPGMKEALRGKLVCSICAGLTIQRIREWVDEDTTVVRAMPNTPSKVSVIID